MVSLMQRFALKIYFLLIICHFCIFYQKIVDMHIEVPYSSVAGKGVFECWNFRKEPSFQQAHRQKP